MKVGILGGGQLGRMLALAGYPLGFTFRFFDPNPESPAGQIGELVTAPYEDEDALSRFVHGLDIATYEFESVPRSAVDFVSRFVTVHPNAGALAAAQDRLREREMFSKLGIAITPYATVDSLEELRSAAGQVGYPGLLKTRRLGYDGKGQARIHSSEELEDAWRLVGSRPSLLERVVEFRRELSVLAIRGRGGSFLTYALIENHHTEGILRFSFAPADVSGHLRSEADAMARRVGDELEYVGVFAIELFETAGGLIANELAPRVHNSGHWTMEGAETSQFENHLRAIAGLPLGSTGALGASAMVNLIGGIPNLDRLLAIPDVHVHLYGKSVSHRRKLGHVNVRSTDAVTVRNRVAELRQVLAST